MVLAASGTAFATGPIAVAGAAAVSQAVSGSQSGAYAGGGSGTGVGVGGNSDSGGNASTKSSKDNSTSVGAALGQAPSAIGDCGAEVRVLFGAGQGSYYSDKCLNHRLAAINEAAAANAVVNNPEAANVLYERANAWVKRADDM